MMLTECFHKISQKIGNSGELTLFDTGNLQQPTANIILNDKRQYFSPGIWNKASCHAHYSYLTY